MTEILYVLEVLAAFIEPLAIQKWTNLQGTPLKLLDYHQIKFVINKMLTQI